MAFELGAARRQRYAGAHRRLARWTFLPAWLGLGAVFLAHVAGLSLPVTVRYGVLLVTLVVLGLPHGAADHHSYVRALGRDLSLGVLARFCAAYLALAAVYAVGWFLAPTVAFCSFIGLTWFHWGQGDLYSLGTLTDETPSRLLAVLSVVVRGGLPMLVPLLFFPDRYAAVARTVVSLFGADLRGWATLLFEADVRLALGVAFAAVTALTLAVRVSASGWCPVTRVDVAETLFLWAFFAAVPPVLAIGVYFALWHSLRHVARLVALDDVSMAALDRGALGRPVERFVRDAGPATVGALALFGGLALAVPTTPASVADIGGLYLVLLAVLTLPHVVVVAVLDRRQGVWGG